MRSALRAVDLLRRPIELLGVDYGTFRELLRVRLLLDMRATRTGNGLSLGLAITLTMLFLTGTIAGVVAFFVSDVHGWVLGTQAFLIFFLFMGLMGEYSFLLVDDTDLRVLAPHPVSDRSLLAVRIVLVLVHLSAYTAGFALPATLLATIAFSRLAMLVLYPLVSVLMTSTALGLVGVLFALLLRVFGPRSFQRVTLWVQIGTMTLLLGGMQVLPHVPVAQDLLVRVLDHPELLAALPPAWGAGLCQLALGDVTRATLTASALALLVPALSLWISLRLATGHFVQALTGEAPAGRPSRRPWRRGPLQSLGLRTLPPRERPGFLLAWPHSRREPYFLRVTLPSVITFQAMVIAMAWPWADRGGFPHGVIPIFAGACLALSAPTAFDAGQHCAHAEARWLLDVSPFENESNLLAGGMKGILFGLFVPLGLLMMLGLVVLLGPRDIPAILLGYELGAFGSLFLARRAELAIPFTRPPRRTMRGSSTTNLAFVVIAFATLGVTSAVGLLLALHPISTWAGMALLVPLVLREYRRLDRAPSLPLD